MEFFTTLREAITDAYAGIVAGILSDSRRECRGKASLICMLTHSPPPADLLQPYVESILSFIAAISSSPSERTEELLRSSIGLLGDICAAYPNGELKQLLTQDWVAELIKAARAKSMGGETRKVASWAREQIRKAM
jgi:importin subunit beta-1